MSSICKRIAALMVALTLAIVLSACGGESAPERYNISGAGVELESFTSVVGERSWSGSEVSDTRVKASYTGITELRSDLDAYCEYLRGQGFTDYFGVEDARSSMVLRRGDDGLVFSAKNESDALELEFEWITGLELSFGQTQYVSGTSLAILPSSDMVIFDYPVLSEQADTQEQVNQLILDGVNRMIQYAAQLADGQDYSLVGDCELTGALASAVTIELKGTLKVGENQEYELSSGMTITGVLDAPQAEYTEVTVG